MTKQEVVPYEEQGIVAADLAAAECRPALQLPGREEMDNTKVYRNMREIFKGYDFDPNDDWKKILPSEDDIIGYVKGGLEDIEKVSMSTDMSEVLHRGAAMARFWCTGYALSKAITGANHGTACNAKLAKELKISVAYIYLIRNVAERMSLSDVYLLGLRGVDRTLLVRLGQVKDANIRELIIKAFITEVKDWRDEAVRLRAKAALVRAVNDNLTTGASKANSTDPVDNGLVEPEEAPPIEYSDTMEMLTKLDTLLKKLADEKFHNDASTIFSSFFLKDTTPGAQEKLEAVVALSERVQEKTQTAINLLSTLSTELTSLGASQLYKDEEDSNEKGTGTGVR